MTSLNFDGLDEFARKPTTIIYIAIAALVIVSEWKSPSTNLIKLSLKLGLILISFILITLFNSLYFKWYNRKPQNKSWSVILPVVQALAFAMLSAGTTFMIFALDNKVFGEVNLFTLKEYFFGGFIFSTIAFILLIYTINKMTQR